MRPSIRLALLLIACLLASPLKAHQDPASVRKAVEDYLRIQTKGLPGQVSFTITGLDPNNQLTPCSAFEVSRPPGARAWGRTNLAVRCTQEVGWNVFVPVHVRIVAAYLVTSRTLTQGQVVAEADLSSQNGDLTDLPAGILTDARQAIGRVAAMSIPAGRPLRSDMLRQPTVVQQGQSVKVVSKGVGFQVANEGRALNSAVDGQVAQVRLQNGQIVSGIARNGGYVEISY